MIEIEFSKPETSLCECCGGTTTRLTRFVYKDGDAFAIYYAAFSEQHPESGLIGIVSVGEWGSDDIPPERVAFAFEMWAGTDEFKVGIIDAATSEWSEAEIIGRKLSRAEALTHGWIDEVFHITDHITHNDPEIKAFFANETIH